MADPSPTGRRRAFLTPPFVRLCLFYFLVFAAGYQLLPVVPLHLRDLGASLAESGRFTTAFTLGSALGALVTGNLGDRLGQRRVLLWACLLSVGFLTAYAFLPIAWAFLPLAFLHGLVWSGLRTASVAKAGHLLAPEHRGEGLSLFGLSAPGGLAVGPFLGLALWPLLGFRGFVAALALTFLALFLLARSLPPEPPALRRKGSILQAPDRMILLPALILVVLGLGYGPLPPYASQEARFLHLVWPSALLTSLALGMVLVRLALGVRGLGRDPIRMLTPMLVTATLGMLLLALAPGGTWRHAVGGALYGGGFGISHTLIFMTVMDRVAPDRRGASVGWLYVSYDAGQAMGALLLGQAMEAAGRAWGVGLGYRLGWGLSAVALLLVLFAAGPVIRASRHPIAAPDGPPDLS